MMFEKKAARKNISEERLALIGVLNSQDLFERILLSAVPNRYELQRQLKKPMLLYYKICPCPSMFKPKYTNHVISIWYSNIAFKIVLPEK